MRSTGCILLAILLVISVGLAGCGASTPEAQAADGDVDALRHALDAGLAVDSRDTEGSTLLHLAAKHGQRDVAKLLIERGAPIEARAKWGNTPLHVAADAIIWAFGSSGLRIKKPKGDAHREVAEMLLDAGASIGAVNDSEATPLHLAARSGNVPVAELLLDRGADVGSQTDHGTTPLHNAAENGERDSFDISTAGGDHEAMVRLLLDRGADPNAAAMMGAPLSRSVRHGAEQITRLLVEGGADPARPWSWEDRGSKPVHMAATRGEVDILAYFLDLGTSPDERAHHGSLLRSAARMGKEGAVELLLDRGATMGDADSQSELLHVAAYSGDVGTLKVFLDHGGDIHAEQDGDTLLHSAARNYIGGWFMIRFLTSKGLDVDATNDAGLTPLEVAEESQAMHTGDALRWYSGHGRQYERAFALVLWLACGYLGSVISKRKGHDRRLGAVLGLTVGGILVALCLPSRRPRLAAPAESPSE